MQFFLIVPGKYSGTSFIWTSACYPGISIVRTAQIGHKSCSLLTMMKFGLDKSTRREPKGCCLHVWWLVFLLIKTTTWWLDDKGFLHPRGMTMNALK